jgi:hypothetical protein
MSDTFIIKEVIDIFLGHTKHVSILIYMLLANFSKTFSKYMAGIGK